MLSERGEVWDQRNEIDVAGRLFVVRQSRVELARCVTNAQAQSGGSPNLARANPILARPKRSKQHRM